MHPDALAAEHVVERSVADEQDVGRLETHRVEKFFEDERIGFSITGVGRDDHRGEEFADTGVVHDLVAGFGIVEIGDEAEAMMLGDFLHRVDSRGRRLGDLAHACHVDSAQILGERRRDVFVNVENFERAREALEAGYLDRVGLGSLGEYVAVNRGVRLREFLAVEVLAQRGFQRRVEQGSRAANFAPAKLHQRQPFRIPGDERVEQIDHDRFVTMLSHAESMLLKCRR